MTAKEYLNNLVKMERIVDCKMKNLERYREESMRVQTMHLSDMPKMPHSSNSRQEELIIKCIDLEEEIKADEEVLRKAQTPVLEAIAKISNPEYREILTSRYIKRMQWDDISEKLFYTKRWIYMMHGKALEELERELDV